VRENCTHGSEGGEARAFPTPIGALGRKAGQRRRPCQRAPQPARTRLCRDVLACFRRGMAGAPSRRPATCRVHVTRQSFALVNAVVTYRTTPENRAQSDGRPIWINDLPKATRVRFAVLSSGVMARGCAGQSTS